VRLYLLIALAAALTLGACRDVILNAPPTATITVSANPTTISEIGGESLIQAIVRLDSGEAVPDGVRVGFFTTLGTIDAEVETRSGIAEATLRSAGVTGIATVSAVSGAAPVGTVDVVVGTMAETIAVSFEPASLPDGGGTATVFARLLDRTGRPLQGRLVTLSATAGSLASGGMPLETDAAGTVEDTLLTIVTSTVTATVEPSGFSGQGRLSVLTVAVGAVSLGGQPTALGECGGDSTISVRVTDTAGQPVSGATVSFVASAGSLSPTTAVTDSSGAASTRLTTEVTSFVTATVGGAAAAITISVGDPDSLTRRILLETTRATVTDSALPGMNACASGGPNAQLPITVDAVVTDRSGAPVNGVRVTLTIEDIDDATDPDDGKGGFCAQAGQVSAVCTVCTGTCETRRLGRTITGTSGGAGAGRVRFMVTFEDPDFCDCISSNCSTRITACADEASALNELRLTLSP